MRACTGSGIGQRKLHQHYSDPDVVYLDAMDFVSGVFRKKHNDICLNVIERHSLVGILVFSMSARADGDDSMLI